MTPSYDDFLQALGRPHTDPKVSDLLRQLGLLHKKIRLKRGEHDIAFDAPEFGIDVILSDPTPYRNPSSVPEGALILTAVFFFSEGREGHRQYGLALPADLVFRMSRDEVLKQLGTPEFTSPILPVYRWSWNGTKLAVTFVESLSSIARVSCSLPKAQ
jgi:hypothetical protein